MTCSLGHLRFPKPSTLNTRDGFDITILRHVKTLGILLQVTSGHDCVVQVLLLWTKPSEFGMLLRVSPISPTLADTQASRFGQHRAGANPNRFRW